MEVTASLFTGFAALLLFFFCSLRAVLKKSGGTGLFICKNHCYLGYAALASAFLHVYVSYKSLGITTGFVSFFLMITMLALLFVSKRSTSLYTAHKTVAVIAALAVLYHMFNKLVLLLYF